MAAQKTIATLRARVAELEEEVARLKKALAAAGGRAAQIRPAKTAADVALPKGSSPGHPPLPEIPF